MKYQKKFLWSSIMVLVMNTTLVKELAEEFEGQFKCLGETETENGNTVTYKINFIGSVGFMSALCQV